MKIFWAWQFELPGRISRHFIRSALEEAIARINRTSDIDEPDEDFQNSLQIDYGRKGLKGSPDLAIEILKKIDSCTVFVGDVTPVGRGAAHRTDEDVDSPGKALMNPNVAIELGYALKSRSTENVLMIMNGHYGKRADMPFDLGHKGGPIIYRLAPEATRQEIEAEKAKLVAVLADALREYLPEPVHEPFVEMKPKIGQGLFFQEGEILGQNVHDQDKTKFVMSARSVAWLRVIPTRPLSMPLSLQTLLTSVGRYGAFGQPIGGEAIRRNAYGVALLCQAGIAQEVGSISQYVRDGEIWGVNADVLREGERYGELFLYSYPFENNFVQQLAQYIRFLSEVSHVPPPVVVEAGVEGVTGGRIAHVGHALTIGPSLCGAGDPMHRDRVVHRETLRRVDEADQQDFLLEFFRKVNTNAGVPRPDGLYGRG
ncbi:hypothetical protein [Bradyrhizobium sp.]|uniref:hypothetical protein n=1 Tax=Bradyrhizobium sp. TaxID=376 RepID=UPI002635C0ED|nr:hypothetical protein [Bradyrhizobium sp.]